MGYISITILIGNNNNNKEMKNNFDLKKFLVENKLTANSRQIVNENIDSFSDVIQVVGIETEEDAIEAIYKYEKEFYNGPVDVKQAKQLVADLRATDEDAHDKNITDLVVKAFNRIYHDRGVATVYTEKKGNLKEEDADFAPSPNSDIPDANAEDFDVATAFKKAGVDMSKPVTVLHSYGSASFGGSDETEMSAEAAIEKLESERQENQKNFTDDGKEVPSDIHGYEFENYSVLEEEMPEGHEYKLSYFLDGDHTYSITQQK